MRKGHTLLELLLVLVVLALLAAMIFANYTGASRRAKFSEQSERFVTLLRALRAQAALDAKRVRMEFQSAELGDDYIFIVSSEAYPLESPGKFVPLNHGAWMRYFEAGDIRVRACTLAQADSLVAAVGGADQDSTLLPITFYPDGSSDTAEVILVSSDVKVRHGLKVELDGRTGTIDTAILSADILESSYP